MVKPVPPHLPPPVCDIKSHREWQRIKIIMAASVFGLIAGITGALMVLGWLWPGYGGGDILTLSGARGNSSGAELDERIRKERINNRVFTVYSQSGAVGAVNYFDPKDRLGEAMVIGSDGWLAMYLPAYNGVFKKWQVLTQTGSVYSLEKALFDAHTGMVYLKLAAKTGETITERVMDFNYDLKPFDEIFVYEKNNWARSFLGYKVWGSPVEAHLDTAPAAFYTLNGSFTPGAIVVTSQGKVAGVVVEDNLLLPNFYITRIMPKVLSQGKVSYPSLGVDGWYGEERPIIVDSEKVNGFLVNRVFGKASLLRRGDVILEINGQIVDPDVLWYNISNNSVQLKVLRNGKYLDFESQTVESS